MNWLPVMTLPDGTTIEISMPSTDDSGHDGGHGYRLRTSTGVTAFATLHEVVDHLLGPGDPHEDTLTMTPATASVGADRVGAGVQTSPRGPIT